MRKLVAPNIDKRAFYLQCAQDTQNEDLRLRLIATADSIVEAAESYDAAGSDKRWFDLPHSIQAVPAADAELRNLYDRTVVRQRRAGRRVYDEIFSSSAVCPMCGQGKVSTLDHYLPKSRYAHFAILPLNMVPCCRDCNVEKREAYPATAGDQSFHPYFDDAETDRWLYANVNLDQGVSLAFFVDAPEEWAAVMVERAQFHFSKFKLSSLFGIFAATELSSVKYRLQKVYLNAGADGVKGDLILEAESARTAHLNSWKTAMYEALSQNDGFCDGGFRSIGT